MRTGIRPNGTPDKLQKDSDSEWKNRMSLDYGHGGGWRQSKEKRKRRAQM